jgi:hypothetical protein
MLAGVMLAFGIVLTLLMPTARNPDIACAMELEL